MSDVAPAPVPIHAASSVGFSLGSNHLYNSGRPAYSDECVDWLLGATILPRVLSALDAPVPATPAPRVFRLVDVGAGTGIFTRCLAARVRAFESAHAAALAAREITFDVTAVEPVEGMRARFEEFATDAASATGRLTVAAGSGESMPSFADGTVDVLFAAQAFHWFATPSALREFARVLRPGGFFAPIWNTRDESVSWVADLEAIITPHYYEGVPRQQTKAWRRVFEPAEESRFSLSSSHEWQATMVQRGGADMVLGRILSVSVIAALPQDQQDGVREKVLALLASHPDTRDRQEYELPYATDAYAYKLKE